MSDSPQFSGLPEVGMWQSFKLDCAFCWWSLKAVAIEHDWNSVMKALLRIDKGFQWLLGSGVVALFLGLLFFKFIFPAIGIAWTMAIGVGLLCVFLWVCVHAVRVVYDLKIAGYEAQLNTVGRELKTVRTQREVESGESASNLRVLDSERNSIRGDLVKAWDEIVALKDEIATLKQRPKISGVFHDMQHSYFYAESDRSRGFPPSDPLGYQVVIGLLLTNESTLPTTIHNFSFEWGELGKTWIAPHAEEVTIHQDRDIWPTHELALRNKDKINLVTYLGGSTPITNQVGIEEYLVFHIPGLGVNRSFDDLPAEGWPIYITLYVEDKWGIRHPIKDMWQQNPRPAVRFSEPRWREANDNS